MLEFPERPDPARLPPAVPDPSGERRRTRLAMLGALSVLVAAWAAWALLSPVDEGRAYDVEPLFGAGVVAPRTAPPTGLLEGDARTIALRVAADAEAMWERTFALAGDQYTKTRISFGDTSTCEGDDEDFIGYYCDEGVFLMDEDLDELEDSFGAEEARKMWAMVVAHEIGHHVQSLRGVSSGAAWLIATEPDEEDDVTVRVELQAECLAGVWAGAAGLDAAVGQFSSDDTHGTADQQRSWFEAGRESRSPAACHAFAEGALR